VPLPALVLRTAQRTLKKEPDVLQMAMSALVAFAGLFVVASGDAEFRLFGWVLVLVGILGVVSGYLMRVRRR